MGGSHSPITPIPAAKYFPSGLNAIPPEMEPEFLIGSTWVHDGDKAGHWKPVVMGGKGRLHSLVAEARRGMPGRTD